MREPLLRCHVIGNGPGPSESIVEIQTTDGLEEVVVDKGFIHGGELKIRRIVERNKGQALVELLQESTSGRWRIWVKDSALAAG